jgi:SNF2 family DNA or RNA helicase
MTILKRKAPLKMLYDGFKPYSHQGPAIQHMLNLERKGTEAPAFADQPSVQFHGGLLADDMGLGKTSEMLMTMKNNPKPKTLLLVPLALVEPWTAAATKAGFCCLVINKDKVWSKVGSSLSTETKVGSSLSTETKVGSSLPTETSSVDGDQVFITNYDLLLHHEALILAEKWDRVVLDEAHRIRNPRSELTKKVLEIDAPIRWALTGTPVVNKLQDAVTLFAFLGIPHTPSMRWDPMYYPPLMEDILIYRSMDTIRGKVSDAPPIPDEEEHILEFASAKERNFYRATAEHGYDYQFEMFLRLRQASVSPATFDKSWTAPSTKMIGLGDLIETDRGRKWIVFCSFHEEMRLVAKYLEDRLDLNVEQYHGGLNQTERTAVLARAKTPACQVLLIQLQAGGCGLNLQEFDGVVFMSPWWTSAMMEQAKARAVRMGQKKVVKVVHLLLAIEKGLNIDTMMGKAADSKRDLLKEEFFANRVLL